MSRRPDYGLDAPVAHSVLLVVGAAAVGGGVLMRTLGVAPRFVPGLALICLAVGANLLLVSGGMSWYSLFLKPRLRERLLDQVPWRGDEVVLDVGCGRGLWLVGAAKRLVGGKAIGVDVWRNDLSGNRAEAVRENARLEGVEGRVEVRDGDARRLPFDDDAFDVIVSCLTLHNLRAREDRRQALREIARVLRPGGRVVLVDLRYTREYVRLLRECGLADARRTPVGKVYSPLLGLLTWGAVRFHSITGEKTVSAGPLPTGSPREEGRAAMSESSPLGRE